MLGISSHSSTSGGGGGSGAFFMDGHQMAANYAHQVLSQLDQIAHQYSGYHHQQQQHHQQTIHQPIPQHPQQQQQQQMQMQSPPLQLQCQSKNGKKSRADYSNALCTICSAPADGQFEGRGGLNQLAGILEILENIGNPSS
jgi:hypothetical protein